MAYRKTKIGRLIKSDPDRVRLLLSKAFIASGGNFTWTAKRLKVDRMTLRRWLRKLGCEFRIENIRETYLNR
jgi:DNA invertase Pin-like site-specific DNA recombinase